MSRRCRTGARARGRGALAAGLAGAGSVEGDRAAGGRRRGRARRVGGARRRLGWAGRRRFEDSGGRLRRHAASHPPPPPPPTPTPPPLPPPFPPPSPPPPTPIPPTPPPWQSRLQAGSRARRRAVRVRFDAARRAAAGVQGAGAPGAGLDLATCSFANRRELRAPAAGTCTQWPGRMMGRMPKRSRRRADMSEGVVREVSRLPRGARHVKSAR